MHKYEVHRKLTNNSVASTSSSASASLFGTSDSLSESIIADFFCFCTCLSVSLPLESLKTCRFLLPTPTSDSADALRLRDGDFGAFVGVVLRDLDPRPDGVFVLYTIGHYENEEIYSNIYFVFILQNTI